MKFSHSTLNTILFLIFILLITCNAGSKDHADMDAVKPKKVFTLLEPSLDQVFSYDDTIHVEIVTEKKGIHPDSVHVYSGGILIAKEIISPLSFSRSSFFQRVGRQDIRLIVYYNDTLLQSLTTRITVLSDIEPEALSYSVIRKLPHDKDAYTQGLFFYRGFLFESTGQKGQSRLLKVDPQDGKILLDRHLGEEFFGEGITRWKEYIYQLTYQQKVGFVYDLESFRQVREFDLQTMEGWGLTNDEKSLIVSDGSSVLYFYDPEYYTQTGQLDVCDTRGLVTRLNELEFVQGFIWANVYGEPFIVKIDAESGKVVAKLDLSKLIPNDIPRDFDHVLNGIAYAPEKNTFYITGKLWPVMYEIQLTE